MNSRFKSDSTATRLNNVCLPRILSNFDFGMITNGGTKRAMEVQAIEPHNVSKDEVESFRDTEENKILSTTVS